MASVRKRIGKRGVSWICDYVTPDGKRKRKSFKMKKQAVSYMNKVGVDIDSDSYIDPEHYKRQTLKMLLKDYEQEFNDQLSWRSKQYFLPFFLDFFGSDCRLINIRYKHLVKFRKWLKHKPTIHDKQRTDASINRAMVCLRHCLAFAVEMDMMKRSPFKDGASLQLKEKNERIRYLTNKNIAGMEIKEEKDEYERLMAQCPDHLKDIVDCAVLSAMRRSEILNLKWSQIIEGWIYLKETKSQKFQKVPICEDLALLFKQIRKRQHLINEYVFTWQGKHVQDIKGAFKGAMRRVGITDFRFHDLRHTAISWYIMNGGSIKGAQELARHQSISTTMRYAHLAPSFRKSEVNLLNGLTGKNTSSQIVPNPHFLSSSNG